jgi:hypothetical protein
LKHANPKSRSTNTQKRVHCRVGDIVAIPIDATLYGFGRILQNHYLAVYARVSELMSPEWNWTNEPIGFHVGFVDKAVRSGEWPIIGHFQSDNPDDDCAPPMCVREYLHPRRVKYIIHRGVLRDATDEEAVGMEEFVMQTPIGVAINIEERLLKRESQVVARLREAQRQGRQTAVPDWESFSNDDAFEVQSALERARGWSTVRKGLSKAVKARGYLEAPPAKIAVAAAEVVAAGCGHAAAQLPEVVPEFLERVGPPDAELLELARAAVARIAKDSELRDLWEESKHFAEWQTVMQGLSKRLSRGRV